MQPIQLHQGKVKYAAGQPRQTQYGERINVVITLSNGEESKLWGNPGDPIAQLRKGQAVSLLHDGKGYKLVSNGDQASRNSSAPVADSLVAPVEPSDEDIRELVGIFQQLKKALPTAREDTCRAFASTIFMQRYRNDIGF